MDSGSVEIRLETLLSRSRSAVSLVTTCKVNCNLSLFLDTLNVSSWRGCFAATGDTNNVVRSRRLRTPMLLDTDSSRTWTVKVDDITSEAFETPTRRVLSLSQGRYYCRSCSFSFENGRRRRRQRIVFQIQIRVGIVIICHTLIVAHLTGVPSCGQSFACVSERAILTYPRDFVFRDF